MQGGLGPPGREIRAGGDRAELFPVAKNARAYGRGFQLDGDAIGVGDEQQVANHAHAATIGTISDKVNGVSADDDAISQGDFSDRDSLNFEANSSAMTNAPSSQHKIKEIVSRVDIRLEALGITATEASRRAGLGTDGVRSMKRSAKDPTRHQGVTVRTLERLAPVLGVTVPWLLTGKDSELEELRVNPHSYVPVVGYVGAGAEAHHYDAAQGPFEQVQKPDTAPFARAAMEIRGESLGAFFDRWLVFVNDRIENPGPDLVGQLCAVGLADGRVLIKKLAASGVPGRFTLLSQFEPPIYDALVEWAAIVASMAPQTALQFLR